MSRSLMLSILGVVIALTPFMGLPQSILTWIVPVLGLLVLGIGFTYRRRVPKTFAPAEESNASNYAA